MTPSFDRVEAREVSKIYERHRALAQVTLTLAAGKVTALLGPNGSGKTTLLSIFSTLSSPTKGTVHFGALPPERSHEARGRIGLVSHASLAYGDLTGLENVSFFARLAGLDQPEPEAARLLAELGLADAMRRAAKTYSRGMLQRLSLARALIGRPSLLLLDEPFTGLDRASGERVVERVRALAQEGVMVLLVSHDLTTTAALADEHVVLLRGKLVLKREGRLSAEALAQAYAQAAEPRVEAP